MANSSASEPILDIIAQPSKKAGEKSHYLGHRDRLRHKVLTFGSDVLQDYELLEMLLTYAIPRRDVKPLAKELISSFGSFSAVLNASPEELKHIKGIKDNTAALIVTARGCALRMMKNQFSSGSIIKDWKSLIEYCKADMGQMKNECPRIIFLDSRSQLIRDEILQKGTVSQTPVYPREIAKRALELGAVSIVMVHNHPACDMRPSKNDIQMTKAVQNALAPLDISLIDHIIISKSGHISFKACGFLKD
ncbi:MAG: DNA repair protein RadC [Alphaproteobacteria bacterium]|nr:DNA repair protein RadC [Alphaproteobacteria bacterium]